MKEKKVHFNFTLPFILVVSIIWTPLIQHMRSVLMSHWDSYYSAMTQLQLLLAKGNHSGVWKGCICTTWF